MSNYTIEALVELFPELEGKRYKNITVGQVDGFNIWFPTEEEAVAFKTKYGKKIGIVDGAHAELNRIQINFSAENKDKVDRMLQTRRQMEAVIKAQKAEEQLQEAKPLIELG